MLVFLIIFIIFVYYCIYKLCVFKLSLQLHVNSVSPFFIAYAIRYLIIKKMWLPVFTFKYLISKHLTAWSSMIIQHSHIKIFRTRSSKFTAYSAFTHMHQYSLQGCHHCLKYFPSSKHNHRSSSWKKTEWYRSLKSDNTTVFAWWFAL